MESLHQSGENPSFRDRMVGLGRKVLKAVTSVGPYLAPPEYLLYIKQAEVEAALDRQVRDEITVLDDPEAVARYLEEWRG